MRQLWTMTASDLRQRVRDKSVLIFGLVVPLALMAIFNLVFGGTDSLDLEPVTVSVSAEADDESAQALLDAVASNGVVDVTLDDVDADAVPTAVADGDADLGLVLPEGFGDAVRAGEAVTVELVEGDGVGLEAGVVRAVVQGVLDSLAAGAVAAGAGAQLGLAPEQLAQVAADAATQGPAIGVAQGEASDEQLSAGGALVAGQAGLFLLFTVGFGVLGLISERQEGTLTRLLSMPMRPGLIVASKALTAYILGAVATGVLLTVGSLLFGVSFGSPLVAGVLVLCVVAAATSLMFIVVRVARTAEQASIVQSILAMVLGVAGGAFFPIAASGALGRVLDLNPVAAFTRGLGISSGGGSLADVGGVLVSMLGFALVCAAVSRLVPDRGMVP